MKQCPGKFSPHWVRDSDIAGYKRCAQCRANDLAKRRRAKERLEQFVPPDDRWREQALCKGKNTKAFYIGDGDRPHKPKATRPPRVVAEMCGLCPVAGDCLRAGLDERFGVWGGTTTYERAWLRGVIDGLTNDPRRPDRQRRAIVLGVAERAGLLGGAG